LPAARMTILSWVILVFLKMPDYKQIDNLTGT
jgi:hypothetical protein